MKMRWLKLLLCSLLVCAWAPLAMAQKPGDVIPGRYIVTLKAGATPGKVIKAHGVAADHVYEAVFKGFAGFIPPGQLKALQADPDVERIVPDRVVRLIDPIVATGKASSKPAPTSSQVVPAGVKRIGADPANTKALLTGDKVGVAVLDTGLDFKHPDLVDRVSIAASYYSPTVGTSAQDDEGHGTHVGGIIAATNNNTGVVGVAPKATLYAVKVLDSQGGGYDSDILGGLNWVSDHAASVTPPIRVINMSLGRPASSDDSSMHSAVQKLYSMGIAVVVAAGNDNTLEVKDQVPAGFPEVFAVASTTALTGTAPRSYSSYTVVQDTASYFTSDGAYNGSVGVTISAPGEDQENIVVYGVSAYINSVGILSTKLGGGTVRMSGTSMAAPHVAGVMARYFQTHTGAVDLEAVRGIMMSKALNKGVAPYVNRPIPGSPDGVFEGIVCVPELWP